MTMKWPSAKEPKPYCLVTTDKGFKECDQVGTPRGKSGPVVVSPPQFGS